MANSKNSRMNRGAGQCHRFLDGKRVHICKYVGHNAGHSTYMAGTFETSSGVMICDSNGKPLPFKSIGVLKEV